MVRATNVALSQPAAIAAGDEPAAGPAAADEQPERRTAPATTPVTRRRCRSPGRPAARRAVARPAEQVDLRPDDGELAGLGEVVAGGVHGPSAVPARWATRYSAPATTNAIERRARDAAPVGPGADAAGRRRARRRRGRTSRPATAGRRWRRGGRPRGATSPARRASSATAAIDGQGRRHLRVDLGAVGGEGDADERRRHADRRRPGGRPGSRRIATHVVRRPSARRRAASRPWPPPNRRAASGPPAAPAGADRGGRPAGPIASRGIVWGSRSISWYGRNRRAAISSLTSRLRSSPRLVAVSRYCGSSPVTRAP